MARRPPPRLADPGKPTRSSLPISALRWTKGAAFPLDAGRPRARRAAAPQRPRKKSRGSHFPAGPRRAREDGCVGRSDVRARFFFHAAISNTSRNEVDSRNEKRTRRTDVRRPCRSAYRDDAPKGANAADRTRHRSLNSPNNWCRRTCASLPRARVFPLPNADAAERVAPAAGDGGFQSDASRRRGGSQTPYAPQNYTHMNIEKLSIP